MTKHDVITRMRELFPGEYCSVQDKETWWDRPDHPVHEVDYTIYVHGLKMVSGNTWEEALGKIIVGKDAREGNEPGTHTTKEV
jgi:hypothetical protein